MQLRDQFILVLAFTVPIAILFAVVRSLIADYKSKVRAPTVTMTVPAITDA